MFFDGFLNGIKHLPSRKWALILLALLLCLFATLSIYTSVVVLQGIPHSQDEVVYLFQAKLYAAGRLYMESLPAPLQRFFDHEFIINDGHWYGKYTPGQSALLSVGENTGVPWLVNPLLGVASLLLLFLFARKLYSWRTAILAGILFTVSPMYILLSASYMSHIPALCCTLAAMIGMLRITDGGSDRKLRRLYALVGVSLGLMFLLRPYNILMLAVIFCGVVLARFWDVGRRRWQPEFINLMACALPFGILALLNLCYNEILTGNFLTFPYNRYCVYDTVGFGIRGVEWGLPFTLSNAIDNLSLNWQATKRYIFAPPGIYALLVIPLTWFGKKRWHGFFLSFFLLLPVVAYFFYFHPGTFMGPRYWSEALWAVFILCAQSCVALFDFLGRITGRKRILNLMFAVVCLLVLVWSLRWDWHLLPRFKGYNDMYRVADPPVTTPALVFVPGTADWQSYGRYFIKMSPFLERNSIIYARDRGEHNVPKRLPPLSDQLLIDIYPDRNSYLLTK